MANKRQLDTYVWLSESDFLMLANQAARDVDTFLATHRRCNVPMRLGIVPRGRTTLQWHDIDTFCDESGGNLDERAALIIQGAATAMRGVTVDATFLLTRGYIVPDGSNPESLSCEEWQQLVWLLGMSHNGMGVQIEDEVRLDSAGYLQPPHFTLSHLAEKVEEAWDILPLFWLGYLEHFTQEDFNVVGTGELHPSAATRLH